MAQPDHVTRLAACLCLVVLQLLGLTHTLVTYLMLCSLCLNQEVSNANLGHGMSDQAYKVETARGWFMDV